MLAGVEEPLTVRGAVGGRDYQVADRQRVLMTVSKTFFSFTDRYGLDVPNDDDLVLAVAIAVALHRLSAK